MKCSTAPFPQDADLAEVREQFTAQFGLTTAGTQWIETHRDSVRIMWETFDAVSCTGFLDTVLDKQGGRVGIQGVPIDGFAWGDWSLTRSG